MQKPIVAVTLGDPAGIGSEIIVKSLVSREISDIARTLVVGDARLLRRALDVTGVRLSIRPVASAAEVGDESGVLHLLDLANISLENAPFGQVSAACGQAAYEYIAKAINLAMNGEVAAVATAPINKESLRAANVPYIGHTEIFGALTGTDDPLTMFETGDLRVFFLTRHVRFSAVPGLLSRERIETACRRALDALAQLGVSGGTLALAALNPHGGEHGLFGDEEDEILSPAVEAMRAQGLNVEGPVPADSVFHLARTGRFAAVMSLYHDQGHIACKTLDFARTVSVTCGMPVLRTSVDHGTAFDIAGTGKADETGMIEAIRAAARYAPHFAGNGAGVLAARRAAGTLPA
jgi:4-hydroxythreonine-4-phosphate dehydrogenase